MIKKRFGAIGGFSTLSFSERVVYIACAIPKGKIMTYGGIARAAGGGALSSQSITRILSRAFDKGEKRIPFHRIVYADGRVWLNENCREERLQKYADEGIQLDSKDRIIAFETKIFDPRTRLKGKSPSGRP